ncbi:MAG: DUF2029 domain-containing protein [Clostridia bacterium]|nr:DUF2029 domain-containing protein [Clostridia bacterium]
MIKNKVKSALSGSTVTQRIFVIGTLALLLHCMLAFGLTEGRSFFSLLHPDRNDTLMDFFNSIYDATYEDPYVEKGNIYPALCFLFYKFFGKLLNQDFFTALQWRNDQAGLVLYTFLLIFSCLVLYKLIRIRDDGSLVEKLFPVVLLLGTVPFWYCFERGNIILQMLILLLFFLRFYKSENKFLREAALICLAISVSIKIYPVFFGLLLIKDKMWKEASRCVLYGAAVFFLPFFLYDGFGSVIQMVENIFATDAKMQTFGLGYRVNISNTLDFLSRWTGLDLIPSDTFTFAFVGVTTAITLIFTKEAWKVQAALAGAIILVAGFSYTYCLIYMVLPLVTFFEKGESHGFLDKVYMILFVCMFAPFAFGGVDPLGLGTDCLYPLGATTIISSLALALMVVMLTVEAIYRVVRPKIAEHIAARAAKNAQSA